MTAPFGNFKYTGTSFGGELAKLASGLVQGGQDAREQQRKAAMEAALQALKEREAGQADQRIELDRGQLDVQRARGAQEALDATERANSEAEERARQSREAEAGRKNAVRVAQIGATSRENVATIRADQAKAMATANPRQFQVIEDKTTGAMVLLNKLDNSTQYIMSPTPGAIPNEPAATPGAAPVPAAPAPHVVGGSATKAPAGAEKTVATNNVLSQGVDAALQAVKANPDAFGLKGLLPGTAFTRAYPQHVQARAAVYSQVADRIHDLIGAAQTKYEYARLEPFIPGKDDPPDAIIAKLDQLKIELKRMNDEYGKMYADDPQMRAAGVTSGTTQPAPSGGKKYTLPDGTVVE